MKNISLSEQLCVWCERTKKNKRVHATQRAYQSYLMSTYTRLEHVYDRYSDAKEYAYNQIMNEMCQVNGYNFRIISFNTNLYSCGYCVEVDGEIYFIRHTASYRDCVKVG